jgi:hypothetical protein
LFTLFFIITVQLDKIIGQNKKGKGKSPDNGIEEGCLAVAT